MRMRTTLWPLVFVAGMTIPTAALAADPAAEALYQEGRRAMVANDLDLACSKFAESQARESAPGTLLNLGDCEERRGHVALARDSFEKAVAGFQASDSRLAYARERLEKAEKRVARLTVHVKGKETSTLTIDGTPAASDVAVRLDRGEHVVVLASPGKPDTTMHLELAEGEARALDLAVGQADGSPGKSGSSKAPPSSLEPVRSPTVNRLMWGSFGLAAAGLLVGTYAGLRTMDAQSTADDNCKAGCNPVGLEAQHDGKTWSPISTVGFITAGVALAVGVGLLVFGKSTPKQAHGLILPPAQPSSAARSNGIHSLELVF